MAFPEPTIDARSYQEILNEALARIPVHNPEWTNHNDSDPGVTLLQLFSFMAESLLYRVNLVPERNRLKFLRLLGIPLQAAQAAQGLVTFSNPRGALRVELLAPDLELTAGSVPFRVRDAVDVLPIEAAPYYKAVPELSPAELSETDAVYRQLYASHLENGTTPAYYETRRLRTPENGAELPALSLEPGADTVDGSLWLALLARSPDEVAQARRVIANRVLTLAIVPGLTDADRVLLAGNRGEEAAQRGMIFDVPRVTDPAGSSGAAYRTLQARPKENLLVEPGVVELPLPDAAGLRTWDPAAMEPLEAGVGDFPPALDEEDVRDRVVTWLRIRPGDVPETAGGQIEARVSYVGINAARITQRARAFAEFLGQGSGEPGQTLTVANTPVIEDSVVVTVNGEPWTRTDDLGAAPPEVPRRSPRLTPGAVRELVEPGAARVFEVDPESGEISFGTGHHGARPPRGAIVQASYDYGGGLQGMVGIGAVSAGASLPSGVKVGNPVPTWGGDEGETVEEAEERIPGVLRHRHRLVSRDDFEEIVRRTPGVRVGRVEILPLLHPELPDFRAEGLVTVMVIPRFDAAQPDAPRPDRLFLDTICDHLDPRRLITTEIHVLGPRYVPVYVSIGIDVVPGHDISPVRERVEAGVREFLSPLFGGHQGDGWPLQRDVEARELISVAARAQGVAKVTGLLLAEGDESQTPGVSISGLALPRLEGLAVQVGPPADLDGLRGAPVEPDGPSAVPIPIVPPEC